MGEIDHMNAHVCTGGMIRHEHPCSVCKRGRTYMKSDIKLPKELLEGRTQRQWRQQKRRELKVALRAPDTLRLGCVYTPKVEGVYVGTLINMFESLKEAWSQKNWGK